MMLEILQFYVSDFWTWLGISIGMCLFTNWTAVLISAIRRRG